MMHIHLKDGGYYGVGFNMFSNRVLVQLADQREEIRLSFSVQEISELIERLKKYQDQVASRETKQ
jgi:hypothetical protein